MEYLPYIVIAGFATFLTRFLPYLIFNKHASNNILLYLQRTSSLLIMIILTFYALASMNFSNFTFGFSAIFSLILALILQIFIKNTLISIIIPTIIYMILINSDYMQNVQIMLNF